MQPQPNPKNPISPTLLRWDAYYEPGRTRRTMLPSPVAATPDGIARRDRGAIAKVASPEPARSGTATLAARLWADDAGATGHRASARGEPAAGGARSEGGAGSGTEVRPNRVSRRICEVSPSRWRRSTIYRRQAIQRAKYISTHTW
jgi:hypothetical protein